MYNLKSLKAKPKMCWSKLHSRYNYAYIKMYLVGNRQHRQLRLIMAAKEQKWCQPQRCWISNWNMTQLFDVYPGLADTLRFHTLHPIYLSGCWPKTHLQKAKWRFNPPTLLVALWVLGGKTYYYTPREPITWSKNWSNFTPYEELNSKA